MSMRSAASCCQPLQESVVPCGARTVRGGCVPAVPGVAAENFSELGITMCILHWLTKRILLSDNESGLYKVYSKLGANFIYDREEGDALELSEKTFFPTINVNHSSILDISLDR